MLLAVTGGIATGKSTFCRLLAGLHSFEIFDADRCVHELLARDEKVLAEVRRHFGPDVFTADGSVDRAKLLAAVSSCAKRRKTLEGILHPPVGKLWREAAALCRGTGRDFLADIPLLFETSGESGFDVTVSVAASEGVRESRLMARGSANLKTLADVQMPLAEKCRRASHVVWNDGSVESLQRQAGLLLQAVRPEIP